MSPIVSYISFYLEKCELRQNYLNSKLRHFNSVHNKYEYSILGATANLYLRYMRYNNFLLNSDWNNEIFICGKKEYVHCLPQPVVGWIKSRTILSESSNFLQFLKHAHDLKLSFYQTSQLIKLSFCNI